MEPLIINVHNSDRQSFLGCRRRWNWVSDLREGYKPIDTPQALSFGTAIHKGLEVGYHPDTWYMMLDPERRPFIVARAVDAAIQVVEETKQRYLKLTGKECLDDDLQEKYLHDLDLAGGLIMHYFEYVERRGLDQFTPVAVEVSFCVPIYTPGELKLFFPYLPEGTQINYKGRIDLLMRDKHGSYWIWDHKTTARIRDTTGALDLDEQLGSYNWGAQQQLGIKIEGNVYAELFKGYPQEPPRLDKQRMGRWFSTNKANPTSYDLAKKTFLDAGEDLGLYAEYLNFLKNEGVQYVRRTPVYRNQHELNEIHERIKLEVRDMLDPELRIYPHPTPFGHCEFCPFKQPCIALNDGSDVQWILDSYFTREKRTNA